MATMRTEQWIALDKQYIWHPFTQMADWLDSQPVVIERGEGFFLIDTEGRRYIDGVSSLWCNVHGHCVPAIDAAIKDQLGRIAHSTLLGLAQTRSIELAERLIRLAPAGLAKVFYSDSGATAVEIALKIAYQYWQNRGQTQRRRFIALREAYHGDTLGSVSVGGMALFHSIFKPLLFETFFIDPPFPYRFAGSVEQCTAASLHQLETLLTAHRHQIAGIIIEPRVQGAAGMIVHPEGFLAAVRRLADQYDTLLIADEVATGFGRTGAMFACQLENVQPDILCLAKGITGGYLPLAATLTTQAVFEPFCVKGDITKTFYHGHTYTGNALACAAALANLELFEQTRLLETLPPKIQLIRQTLAECAKLPYVGDVRQCGLMAGIELVADKEAKTPLRYGIGAAVCAVMRPKGLMLRPLGNVVVLMPPPAMDMPTLTAMLDILLQTLRDDLPAIVNG